MPETNGDGCWGSNWETDQTIWGKVYKNVDCLADEFRGIRLEKPPVEFHNSRGDTPSGGNVFQVEEIA